MSEHGVTFNRKSLASLRVLEDRARDFRRQGKKLIELPIEVLKEFAQAGILQSLARAESART